MHNWNGWDWSYGGGLIMGLGMLLVWLIPLGLIIAVVMYLNNQNKTTQQPETAMELLEKAYASGEISRDVFLQKKNDINDSKK
jgi:putative membrane protein